MIEVARLKQVLEYDPETGIFRWLVDRTKLARAGSVAGSADSHGYRAIRVDGKRYSSHRLAWLYMTGDWPADQVDHVNGIRDDNRWGNLREATRAENCWNSIGRRHNTSGVKGVAWNRRRGKWMAYISVNKRRKYLGYFTDLKKAAAAYAIASKKFHGPFGRL